MTEETDSTGIDLADVHKRLMANERALRSFFYERDEVVRMANTANLCKQHVCMLGPAGTAKSLLVRCQTSQYSDAVYREFLLSRQSAEADVIAHKSVPDFLQGKEVWLLEGHLTEGHFAFADEIFKSNGSTLNSMLAWLNERIVKGVHKVPLISAYGASNETPEDESLAALRDRLVISHWIDDIQDSGNYQKYLRDRATHREPPKLAQIALDELAAAQDAVRSMPFDDAVFQAVEDVKESLGGVGVRVSPRRAGQVLVIMQAYAWLDGATSVGLEHVDCLRHCLWQDPGEIQAVEAAVGGIDKGIVGEIRQIVEDAIKPYYEATGLRNGDGSWSSNPAKVAYKTRCPEFMDACLAASREIKSRFGGQVPDRVRKRAKDYMDELRAVFERCKADANVTI